MKLLYYVIQIYNGNNSIKAYSFFYLVTPQQNLVANSAKSFLSFHFATHL